MNILFTCAGRRNYLLQYFREALHGEGKIVAADASPDAPALQEADTGFVAPPVEDGNYIDAILGICKSNDIRMLISLNDLELPVLSHSREEFLKIGTLPVVSDKRVIDICFDKWATMKFIDSLGYKSPATFLTLTEAYSAIDTGGLQFPIYIKPRWGTASIGITIVNDKKELELGYEYVRYLIGKSMIAQISNTDPDHTLLIQQKLNGLEYGLDIVNDLKGNNAAVFVKKKLGMRAGETDRAVTVRDERIEHVGETIGRKLMHIGNLDCDLFLDNGDIYILELNPRFGGGYPFSHVAGSDVPSALIAWALGNPVKKGWLSVTPGIQSAKCDRLVRADKSVPVFMELGSMV